MALGRALGIMPASWGRLSQSVSAASWDAHLAWLREESPINWLTHEVYLYDSERDRLHRGRLADGWMQLPAEPPYVMRIGCHGPPWLDLGPEVTR